MDSFKAPYFSGDELRNRAERFLEEHHVGRAMPVPIEHIVERMGIDIVPAPNLQIDAYTTGDLKEIWVEEFVYKHRWYRYRFSLAHEVGHIVLHSDIFRSAGFRTVQEWKDFLNAIPDKEYGYLEYHANAFAGHVLVPQKELHLEVETCKNFILEIAPDAAKDPDAYRDFIGKCLTDKFEVSHQTAMIRMNRENIYIT